MSLEYNLQLSVVFVGDESVGKTSLVQRIIGGDFNSSPEYTIGVDVTAHILTLRNNEKVKLQMWDTSGKETFHNISSSYYRITSIVCIVVDASSPSQNKIAQIQKYLNDRKNKAPNNKHFIVIIENKSDMPSATQLFESELNSLESLGVNKNHYIYASAKLDQTLQGKTIAVCFEELMNKFIRKYIDDHQQELMSALPSQQSPSVSQSASMPIFSLAWWMSIFLSSTSSKIAFEGVEAVRAQITRFSSEEAIKILQAIHKHLVKGNANNNQAKPYELTFGGGSNTFFFIDRSLRQERECVYKHYYPDNILRWLCVCMPYVHYCQNMPAAYKNSANQDLLRLFDDIINTVGNLPSSWLRHPSTAVFYKALPTFFHPECVPEKTSSASSPKAITPLNRF